MPEAPNIRPGKAIDQSSDTEPSAVTAASVPPEVAMTETGPNPDNPTEVMEAVEKLASPDPKKRKGYVRSNRTTSDPEWPPRGQELPRMNPGEKVRHGPAPGDIVVS